MKRKHLWRMGGLLALGLFLYPHPSTDFLYRNAEVLEGRISNLKGASRVLFLDPGFYYKFRIRPADLAAAVSALGLRESTMADFHLKLMEDHGPWFWNAWWWRPADDPAAKLYTGNRDGNDFYLLYNPHSRVAHLYIQNT
jgi:hypothetical protein